jgi:hypothetical protein
MQLSLALLATTARAKPCPARRRLEQQHARRLVLMQPKGEGPACAAELLFGRWGEIGSLSQWLKDTPGVRRWLDACVRAGVVERIVYMDPYFGCRVKWQATNLGRKISKDWC